MRRRPVQFLTIAIAALLVLGATGCGSKKSSNGSTTTTTTSTVAASTTSTTTTTPPATTTTTTASTTATSGLGALTSASNCKDLLGLDTAFASALEGSNGDLEKEQQVFQQFAAKTPPDIRPDFEIVANAFTKIAGALKGVNYKPGQIPDAATLAKLEQLGNSLNTTQLTKAEQAISTWAANNCH